MQGIYTYIPETNHIPREYIIAAVLLLLFMVRVSLFTALTLLYFYISTFRMCAVPNTAVFCSSLTSWFYYYYYYYLLQLSFHSVAVILTQITHENKYAYTKHYKNIVLTIQNTVNTSTHTNYQNTHTIVKTPTHYKTHNTHIQILPNKLKQPQYKIHNKYNSHSALRIRSPHCAGYF
jgi:uncharacterized paraquat-inducible protein A